MRVRYPPAHLGLLRASLFYFSEDDLEGLTLFGKEDKTEFPDIMKKLSLLQSNRFFAGEKGSGLVRVSEKRLLEESENLACALLIGKY